MKGRGKNAPDRAALVTGRGTVIEDTEPLMPPVPLPPDAAVMWEYVTRQRNPMMTLRAEDSVLLHAYCMHWQVYCDAMRSYSLEDPSTRTREMTEKGYKRNSDIDVMAKETDAMVKIAKELGFSARSRAAMNLTGAMTASIAASIPERIAAMVEAGS